MSWKTIASTIGMAGLCCIVSVPGVIAQGAPKQGATPLSRGQNPPGAPGGPGALTPEQQAKFKAWQTWNTAHKPIVDLQTMLRKVERLDKEKGSELTKPQATKLIAVIKPWRTKTEMTNDQASSVMKSMTAVLTPAQITTLTTMQGGRGGGMGGGGRRGGGGPGGGGPGGPGGGGPRAGAPGGVPGSAGTPGGRAPRMGGGPGGPGGPGGAFKMPDPPKNGYNPLNPATLPFEQTRDRAKKNLDEFMTALAAKK